MDPGRGRLKRALLLRPPASHLPQGRGDPLMDCADYEETHLRKRVDLCALRETQKSVQKTLAMKPSKCSVFLSQHKAIFKQETC